MIKPPQKHLDFELKARVPQGDYHVTRPVTIYTEALEKKNFPMSAHTGSNPFARTSGFTQPINQTRAAIKYEGNVNFEQEHMKLTFLRSEGTNLSVKNPYMIKEVPSRNLN